MNCPGGLLIYKSRRAATATCRSHGRAGPRPPPRDVRRAARPLPRALFTQDDAHIYCTPEQLEDEVTAVVRFMHQIYAPSASATCTSSSPRGPRSDRLDEIWEPRRERPAARARGRGHRLPAQPRRRRLLRPQDRLPHPRRHGPHLAVRHDPGGLRHARAPRHQLHRRRQRGAPAGHDPPRPAGRDRALHGHPAGALRRQSADVAGAGAGAGAARRRPARRRTPQVVGQLRAARAPT